MKSQYFCSLFYLGKRFLCFQIAKKVVTIKGSLLLSWISWFGEKGFILKSIGFIEKLKGLSSKELILLGIILSIFLPFYLFVVVFCLYIISLIFTGDMKSILQKMGEHPMLLLFLGYSTVISVFAQNWMGVVASVRNFSIYCFLFALSVDFIT